MPGIIVGGGGSNQETTLDKILKGLALASHGIGIAGGIRDFQLKGAQLDAADRQNKGIITKPEAAMKGLVQEQESPLLTPFENGNGPIVNGLREGPRFSKLSNYSIPTQDEKGNVADVRYSNADAKSKMTDAENSLREKYDANKTTVRSNSMYEALSQIEQLAANPGKLGPAQIGVLTKYMKILDPDSAVRANEFDAASNAGGWASAAKNFFNKVATGKPVDEELSREFVRAAKTLMKGQLEVQSGVDRFYEDLASENGFKKKNIINPSLQNLNDKLKYEEATRKSSSGPRVPKVGEIRPGNDGQYEFLGGDQYDKNNWKKK